MSTDHKELLLRQAARLAIRANDFALNGDYIDAVKYYTQAIDHCGEHAIFSFYLNRALCLLKMDFSYLALFDANQAVRLSPQNVKCYYIRSRVLRKLKRHELAQNDLKIAMKICPNCEIIREESQRINEQSERELCFFNEKLKSYNLNDKTYYKIKVNFHLIKARDLPTNIWNYNGIPYFQGKTFKELCQINDDKQYKSLRLYFAPTDHQIELKYFRPNYPPINTQECYFWRTTYCNLKERCPKFHLQPCKNVDAQMWMFK
ncbi:39s ribosomal protein l23 [Dermatophagoides farinae]|uniref:39s ribosomal protein l23 n=1 Tax=Dermatophagoides farinae TaxID=6954 RepID=A0A9D4SLX0_DERFA|nr:39s ribosomal protein l23 [Dermatophagoides farinae]